GADTVGGSPTTSLTDDGPTVETHWTGPVRLTARMPAFSAAVKRSLNRTNPYLRSLKPETRARSWSFKLVARRRGFPVCSRSPRMLPMISNSDPVSRGSSPETASRGASPGIGAGTSTAWFPFKSARAGRGGGAPDTAREGTDGLTDRDRGPGGSRVVRDAA